MSGYIFTMVLVYRISLHVTAVYCYKCCNQMFGYCYYKQRANLLSQVNNSSYIVQILFHAYTYISK